MAQQLADKDNENIFLWSTGDIKNVQTDSEMPDKPLNQLFDGLKKAESRDFPRLDLKLPILYRKIEDQPTQEEPPKNSFPKHPEDTWASESCNVSAMGLCMKLNEKMPKGTLLALSIHVPNQGEKYEAIGQVMWSQNGEQNYLTGIQFVIVENDTIIESKHLQLQKTIAGFDA